MNDDRRRLMREYRNQALAVELRIKEKRRALLMEQVQTILDKCVTQEEPNVSKVEPLRYRLITEPLLQTPVRKNSSLCEPYKKGIPKTSYSLPSTPLFDDISIENLHKKFLQMKDESKDVSVSSSSAISTDLGPYMHHSSTCSSSSGSSTPRATSDTDVSTSLDCSTPIKSRVRRLSYTLDAPSPVLLKVMQIKAMEQEKNTLKIVPKLNLSSSDDSLKNSSIESKPHQKENLMPKTSSDECQNSPHLSPNKKEAASTAKNIVSHFNIEQNDNEDMANGNSPLKPTRNILKQSLSPSVKSIQDDNGNAQQTQGLTGRNGNVIEEFLMQQQKLMNDLLEKQAKEQERLVHLFKEQEEQLVTQLQRQLVQPMTPPTIATDRKSPACRSLQQSFDRSAKARCLFNSGRLSALIRGYLTRRLFATDRVQSIIQTIRDTTSCLKDLNQGNMKVVPSDIELHKRLLQQLNGAIYSLHEIFFVTDVNERMLLIARDREKKAGQMIVSGIAVRMRPRSRSLSSATVKSLERKLSRQNSSRNSSRPSSASTAQPRTSPSSMASSMDRKRSPSSASSFSTYSVGQFNGNCFSLLL